MSNHAAAHHPSACLREAEAASLRRRQVRFADTSPASLGRNASYSVMTPQATLSPALPVGSVL